jgi:LysR family transcriptional regulator, cyn operon transcriptional activator
MTDPDDAIELRHLRYFATVAETENFTRAAQRLRISQPSVSQQIAQLERVLGTPLFRRSGKRVQLTEAGAAFRRSAQVVLRKLDEARAAVGDLAGALSGHVDVAAIPVLQHAWLPAALAHLARKHPGVTVGVRQLASSDIETELEAGRVDIGIGLMSRGAPGLRYERLMSEPFSLLVPAGSRFAGRKSIAAAELHGERLVLLPASFDMRRMADEIFRRARVRPRVVFEIDNIDTVLSSVRLARTPTLLPAIALRGREALRLIAIPLAGRVRALQFGLLWPAGSTSPAAVALADAVRAGIPGAQ